MRPEQQATQLLARIRKRKLNIGSAHVAWIPIEDLARAIRAAENAALERAARLMPGDQEVGLAAGIRALKSRAPRRAQKNGRGK